MTLPSIAAMHGIDDWRVLASHPGNSSLLARGRSASILAPGDDVWIPDRFDYVTNAFTGHSAAFRASPLRNFFRLVLRPTVQRGVLLTGWRYQLDVLDATYTGRIPDSGRIEHEIDPSATSGTLRLAMDDGTEGWMYALTLKIGHLDPIDQPSGVTARLRNLGYLADAIEAMPALDSPIVRVALADFQRSQRLPVTEQADDTTRQRLVDLHGA